MEEANKLISTGKKHLVTGKVLEAVSVLQEACGLLAKQFGDTADECGEAFFWCGKALLDLSRMENSVLGNALEGVPEEDEDEDKPKDSNMESTENMDEKARDELRVQVYDAMAEKTDGKQSVDAQEDKTEGNEVVVEPQIAEKVDGDEDKKDEDGKKSEAEKKTDEEPDDGDAGMEGEGEEPGEGDATAEKDDEDEDEVGNLQLAWEMLEVAKVIYKRKETKEDQLMAAQAHLRLGEVSVESGNYTQALEDFQECLKLQLKHLDSDSRLLAETHYQLGLTYSLNLQYSESIKALNKSISVIKNRLEKLQELLDRAGGPEALPDERKELEELQVLLPEIQEKVEDAAEGLKMIMKDVVDGNASSFPDSTVNSDSSSSAVQSSTVSDISHLVRKKRKPEESPEKEANMKRAKQDDGGDPNGHADDMKVST